MSRKWQLLVLLAAVFAVGCQQAEYTEHMRVTPPTTSSTGEGASMCQTLKTPAAADMPEGLVFCRWCGHTFVLAGNQWILWEGRKQCDTPPPA